MKLQGRLTGKSGQEGRKFEGISCQSVKWKNQEGDLEEMQKLRKPYQVPTMTPLSTLKGTLPVQPNRKLKVKGPAPL